MAKVSTKKSAASRSNVREAEERSAAPTVDEFDYTSFFKDAGLKYTEEDLRDVGGLMPIYASEHAAEENWPPLFGLMLGIRNIHVDKTTKTEEEGKRLFIVVEAEVATKGLQGTGDDREVVDIEPGQRILMPVTGAVKNLDEVLTNAMDDEQVHRCLFRVTGERIKMKKPGRTPMWEVKTKMVDDPIPRRGRYAFHAADNAALPSSSNGVPSLPRGQIVNSRGEINNSSLVG